MKLASIYQTLALICTSGRSFAETFYPRKESHEERECLVTVLALALALKLSPLCAFGSSVYHGCVALLLFRTSLPSLPSAKFVRETLPVIVQIQYSVKGAQHATAEGC